MAISIIKKIIKKIIQQFSSSSKPQSDIDEELSNSLIVYSLHKTLAQEDKIYIETIKKMLQTAPPAFSAMCVVAYENLQPIETGFFMASKLDGGDATSYDDFLKFLTSIIERGRLDELHKRRIMYFINAGLIKRAGFKAYNNPELHDDVAIIWTMLIRGSAHLRALLEHNVIWSEEEKEFFTGIKNDYSGMRHAINIVMPKWLQDNIIIKNFRDEYDLW